MQDRLDAGIGAALTATPLWATMLHDVSLVASAIASFCGMIVGVGAVMRMWRRSK
jgi:hypothetical protein